MLHDIICATCGHEYSHNDTDHITDTFYNDSVCPECGNLNFIYKMPSKKSMDSPTLALLMDLENIKKYFTERARYRGISQEFFERALTTIDSVIDKIKNS